MIFNIHTKKMSLSDDVDLEELVHSKADLSGADIKVGVGVRIMRKFATSLKVT